MLKAYKYRIYPNDEQKVQLAKTFGSCRFVYNHYLAKKIELYKTEQKSISKYDCNNLCNRELKAEFIWLKEIDKFALTNVIYDLDSAYQKFFKEHAGFPKFKSKHDHNYSYTTNFTNNNIETDYKSNKIKLPKLKWVKCKLHREFNGVIKSATISQVPSGKYFVSVLVEQLSATPLLVNNKVYAFDLGLKEFLIDSNGNHIERPKALYQYEEKLKKLQRQLCKMTRHSNNYKKQTKKIAKLHEKISNIRNDFSNKLSWQIINDNQVIISEDLQISNMIKNHNLAKSVADVGWSDFMKKLSYKADWYRRTYHKINTWYASSQTCSDCGTINKKVKLLSVRDWVCEECGAIHQRDENAAKNILNQGLKDLGLNKAS
jgi:putative transposase